MLKGFKRTPRAVILCLNCGAKHLVCDPKVRYCPICAQLTKPCKCGCGKILPLFSKRKFSTHTCFHNNVKGKTYLELYGMETPACGFKRGLDNVAKRPEVREKILTSMQKNFGGKLGNKASSSKRYKTKDGTLVRSGFELQIYNLLLENQIPFEYEVKVRLIDGSFKLVDFKIRSTYLEVTGAAWPSWQKQFRHKLRLLKKSISEESHIIIVATRQKVKQHNANPLFFTHGTNFWIRELENPDYLLKTIKWCLAMDSLNDGFYEESKFETLPLTLPCSI